MRLYVIGVEGQVARSLKEAAGEDAGISIAHGGRPDLDILHPQSIEKALVTFKPDMVINPAAYTAVDRAEAEPDQAFAVNHEGAKNVAAIAARLNIPVVHFSTDYVFDGKKMAPYVETDKANPQSIYGTSKLEGEQAVALANHRHIILRTSWVYSPFASNFVRTVLRLAFERNKLRVVDDQIGCPTYAPDIAAATLAIARKVIHSGWQKEFAGVTHLAGPEEVTWCAFARRIMLACEKRAVRFVPVEAITTSDYPTAATRPANSRLNCHRLQSMFDIRLPPLEASLEKCLDRLLGAKTSPRSTT